jgi:hypothetical protein
MPLMASSRTNGADDDKAEPAPASLRPDDLDRGWSLSPKAEVPKDESTQADPKPETPAEPPEPVATAEPKAPPEEPPPAEASPPADASQPKASPLAEPSQPKASPAAEPSSPLDVSPPAEPSPSVQAPPVVETLPPEALWPPLAKPPPLPVTAASAAEATASLGKPGPLALLLGTPPTKGWYFVGGVGMIVALFVGIVIGRGLPRPAERAAAAPVSPPRSLAPSVAPAPAPAPAPPPAQTATAQPALPRTGGGTSKPAPGPFNAQAAKVAIDRVVPRLKGCKQPGEPPGTATVTVTFAPTGRVSNAAVTTQRYAGTRTGTCIATRLREARVPEFTGKPVTVKRGVAVK